MLNWLVHVEGQTSLGRDSSGLVPAPIRKSMGDDVLKRLPGFVFAGFWIRWVANLIDGLVINLACQPISFAVGRLTSTLIEKGVLSADLASSLAVGFNMAFQITLGVVYFGVIQPTYGASFGKKILGLQLLGADLELIDWKSGLKRYVMLLVSWLPFGIGLIAAAFHPRKQGWHDRVAHTVVVHRDRLASILADTKAQETCFEDIQRRAA